MNSTEAFYSTTNKVVCQTLAIDEVDHNIDLFEAGLLDSLALVSLMVALEEAFDITISPEELDIDMFRSVNSIAMMVQKLSKISA